MSNINDFVIENGVLRKYTGKDADVVIPDSVTSIGDSAFAYCKYLQSITIPDSVTSIGDSAFFKCEKLKSIIIPDSVKHIGNNAFSGCTFDDEDEFAIIRGCLMFCKKTDEEITIPDGVESIVSADPFSRGAFQNRENITCLRLPKSVKKIIGTPFFGMSKLSQLHIYMNSLGENMFGSTGKTIELVVYEEGKEPVHIIGAFRREYYAQCFNIKKDCLLPFGADIPEYDKLVSCGKYEGFQMNDDGRLKAMLFRLCDKKNPVNKKLVPMFAEFLAAKMSKVVKFAEEREKPEYIAILRDIGAVPEDKKKRLINQLKKSSVESIRQMSEKLDDCTPIVFSNVTPSAPVEEPALNIDAEFVQHLKTIQAKSVLMRNSIDELPEVLLKSSKETAPEQYLQLILAEYIIQGKNAFSYKISQIADKAADFLDRDSLSKALSDIYMKSARHQQIAPAVLRFCDGETALNVYRVYKSKKWSEDFAKSIALLSDTREMMLVADKENILYRYAYMRGLDAEVLRDTVIYDFGFDENGVKPLSLGEKQLELIVSDDLSVYVRDVVSGKISKSIPKKGTDPELYKKASADFKEIKKNVKKAVKNKKNTLFQEFLDGSNYSAESWKTSYMNNPILRIVANLIVWQQNDDTFILKGKVPTRADGSQYCISSDKIKVAHPMEMKHEDVTAWQQYFVSNGIKQPFEQIWEPVIDGDQVKPDRYKDARIPYYRFTGKSKHGIFVEDYDFHNEIIITLKDCEATVNRLDWQRHMIDVTDCFEIESLKFKEYTRQVNHLVAYFDKCTIYERIAKDDVAVEVLLKQFTLAQITEFIRVASENNATNVQALLLEYKNNNFADFDPMEEFTLD